VKPLFALLLLCARSASAEDPAAARYRQALRESFLHASPPPAPPAGVALGDPSDPASAAWLVRTVGELESGTAADPLASIRAAAKAVSPSAPQLPADDVVADYLRRRKSGPSPENGPPRPEVAAPDSARGAELHARRMAALLAASAGPGSSPVVAAGAGALTGGGTAAARARAGGPVSDLRTTAPPPPTNAPAAGSPSLLSQVGAWTYETGKGYATGALNLVNDAANLSNRGANALLSLTPIEYRFRTDMHIAAATPTEQYAQNAIEVASVFSGGVGLVRSAPEIAAVSERLAARTSSLVDRVAGRGAPDPLTAPAIKPPPAAPPVAAPKAAPALTETHAPIPGERTFLGRTYQDISLQEAFNPEEFEALARVHPELRVIAADEKFGALDGLSREEAERRIAAMYPGRFNDGFSDWNAYLRRKMWREEAGGRPIPGDPGGPPSSEVDRMMGSPHLPPQGAAGVVVEGAGGTRATLYNEVSGESSYLMGHVNAYGPDLKRLGSLPYSIQQGGRELSIGHMYVDSAARSQVVGATRAPGIGTPMIAEMIRANPDAVAVKAVLMEDNGAAFADAFARNQDYFEGIRNTPLYKALARQGFTKIRPPVEDWRESPFIPFEVTK
jgi:hypothetical protein